MCSYLVPFSLSSVEKLVKQNKDPAISKAVFLILSSTTITTIQRPYCSHPTATNIRVQSPLKLLDIIKNSFQPSKVVKTICAHYFPLFNLFMFLTPARSMSNYSISHLKNLFCKDMPPLKDTLVFWLLMNHSTA
jgi:hypothetical protein